MLLKKIKGLFEDKLSTHGSLGPEKREWWTDKVFVDKEIDNNTDEDVDSCTDHVVSGLKKVGEQIGGGVKKGAGEVKKFYKKWKPW